MLQNNLADRGKASKDAWFCCCRPFALLLLLLAAIAQGSGVTRALMDSLRKMDPSHYYYRIACDPELRAMTDVVPDSQTLHMVGKWGHGPAWQVTGRDSLVFLSLGSECAIIDFADSAQPRVLAEIQAQDLVANSVFVDSLLFIGGNGIDIWNVANPSSPQFLSRINVKASDIFARDTLLYSVCSDSFRVFDVANPLSPQEIGASCDSGYSMSVSGNYAYLPGDWVMGILDISDPHHPHWVGSYGDRVTAVFARDTFAYISTLSNGFQVLNVANPANPYEVGCISSLSGSRAVYVTSFLAYLPSFLVIDISNPTEPAIVGQWNTPHGKYGVWVASPWTYAYVADYDGLEVVDIHDMVNPRQDTMMLLADCLDDVEVKPGLAVVADGFPELHMLDLSDEAHPAQVGSYTDSLGLWFYFVTSTESCCFCGEGPLIAVDISDPTHPRRVGASPLPPVELKGLAIRDTFLYAAGDCGFMTYSIANVAAPRMLGHCTLPTSSGELFVTDTLAYVANLSSLQIINVRDPSTPTVIGSCHIQAYNVVVIDTVAYVAGDAGLYTVNVSDPTEPNVIAQYFSTEICYGLAVRGTRAYLMGYKLHALDVSRPDSVVELASCNLPNGGTFLRWSDSLVCVACGLSGVCIFDTLETGVSEASPVRAAHPGLSLNCFPVPATRDVAVLARGQSLAGGCLTLMDVTGRVVSATRITEAKGGAYRTRLDLSKMDSGVYFLGLCAGNNETVVKIVKQ